MRVLISSFSLWVFFLAVAQAETPPLLGFQAPAEARSGSEIRIRCDYGSPALPCIGATFNGLPCKWENDRWFKCVAPAEPGEYKSVCTLFPHAQSPGCPAANEATSIARATKVISDANEPILVRHDLPSVVLRGTRFKVSCEFDPADLPCAQARHSGKACKWIESEKSFECLASKSLGENETSCGTFAQPGDARCLKARPKIVSVPTRVVDPKRQAQEEGEWIASRLQMPNGAITLASSVNEVSPYFANFGARALLRLQDPKYNPVVRKWMVWYFDRLNPYDARGGSGTVYQYGYFDPSKFTSSPNDAYRCIRSSENGKCLCHQMIAGGTECIQVGEEGRFHYDSSDSFAATFLSLAKAYSESDREAAAFLKSNLASLRKIVSVLDQSYFALPAKAGALTYALPGSKDASLAFLMDNVEVWKGYQDAASLFRKLSPADHERAAEWDRRASAIRKGIESSLWSPKPGAYLVSLKHKQEGIAVDLSTLYPDAIAQIWPILEKLPEAASRKKSLWQKFLSNQAGWITPAPGQFAQVAPALAALEAGDRRSAEIFANRALGVALRSHELSHLLDRSRGRLEATDRRWPWFIQDDAFLIELLLKLSRR